MCSAAAPSRSRNAHPLALLALLAALLVNLAALPASAQSDPDAFPLPPLPGTPEAWLVTYGPGEIYWQRFGHNAIRVRDSALGLDHTFNFGFFDFAQEDFFWRFLRGRMLYFSAAQPTAEEFGQYRAERRSIRVQRLDLDRAQAARLVSFLLREVQPEHRDYLYDYYRNNCATRIRDALDMALDGQLSSAYRSLPATQNWRAHTLVEDVVVDRKSVV